MSMELIGAIAVLGGLGLLLGLILAVADKVFYVEPDLRYDRIMELLPQVNCGACGYPGCAGFTDGILEGEVKNLGDCKPGKKGPNMPILQQYLQETPGPDGEVIKVNI